MKRKQASIMLSEYAVRIIIACILFSSIAIWLARRCDQSTDTTKSFSDLISIANQLKEGELRSTSLKMNKDSIILLFNKGSDQVTINSEHGISQSIKAHSKTCNDDDSACACLYQDMPDVDLTKHPHYTAITKGKQLCIPLNFDIIYHPGFSGTILKDKFASQETYLADRYGFEGGSFIHRSAANIAPKSEEPRLDKETNRNANIKTIYMEKYKGVVAFCEWSPCLTDEDKLKIDTMNLDPETSFKDLVKKINEVEEGKPLSSSLLMAEDSIIMFFSKGSNKITTAEIPGGLIPLSQNIVTIQADHEACPKDSACACLYDKLPVKDKNNAQDTEVVNKNIITYRNMVTSGKATCFPLETDYIYHPGFSGTVPFESFMPIGSMKYSFDGGSYIHRSWANMAPKWTEPVEDAESNRNRELRTVYIEKYKIAIAVCEWQPCLTVQDKINIDQMT